MSNNSKTDVKKAAKQYRDVFGFNVIPLKAGSKVAALQRNYPTFTDELPTRNLRASTLRT